MSIEKPPFMDLGEGPIHVEALPEIARNLRHNQRTLLTLYNGHQDIVLSSMKEAAAARAAADNAIALATQSIAATQALEQDLYGNPKHPEDTGVLGELKAEIKALPAAVIKELQSAKSAALTRATWIIFGAVISTAILVAASAIFHVSIRP